MPSRFDHFFNDVLHAQLHRFCHQIAAARDSFFRKIDNERILLRIRLPLRHRRAVGMNSGEQVRIGDVTVHAVAAAHEFLARDPATGLYPCLQYIIEGNGIRIYHAGDTLRYEGMLLTLQQFGRFDAALLPINGRDGKRYRSGLIGNLTFQEAADLAGELRPRLVIPGHWDMFPGNTGDPEAFADYLEAKYRGSIPCHIPKVMEPITLTAERHTETPE